MTIFEESLAYHYEKRGKIEVISTVPVKTNEDLSIAYTPGVAQPCLEIQKDVNKSYALTRRWNLCLVVTDGTAVLGLGDIGPEAAMPVMEGKCVLFKEFGDVDAFPLCIKSKDVVDIVKTINLISGLTNAMKVTGKKKEEVSIVINGAGAAAISVTKLLYSAGYKDIILCDRTGAIYEGREGLNESKEEISKITNRSMKKGNLADVITGADIFCGFSAPGALTGEMVKTMAPDSIIFACANPTPEIFPDYAKAAGALIIATGRSDFPNQVNNVLAFPGIFRGVFDVNASDINEEMKIAAAEAIAGLISDEELTADYIIPSAFDPKVGKAVAAAVAEAAKKTGVARSF